MLLVTTQAHADHDEHHRAMEAKLAASAGSGGSWTDACLFGGPATDYAPQSELVV